MRKPDPEFVALIIGDACDLLGILAFVGMIGIWAALASGA